MATSSSGSGKVTGFLLLFSLPFAAVGVGTGIWMVLGVVQFERMQSWVQTPATITSAKLESHRGDKGSTTYQAVATYSYTVGGRPFTGQRVGVLGGNDNIGRFQQDAYAELKQHLDQHTPFRCFVNPDDPAQAVLYRNLRWEMSAFITMFACLFGSVGFGMLTGVLLARRKSPQTTMGDAPADEPWKARPDWAAGHIAQRSVAATGWPVVAAVAIWWSVASLPLLVVLPQLLADAKTDWKWLMLIYPAVAGILVIAIAYQFLRSRKFGESVFQLAGGTGVIGGQLAGVVRISHEVQPEGGFYLRLLCMETIITSSGGKTSRQDIALWQDEQTVTETLRGGLADETAVPVLFAIPFDSLPTTSPGDRQVKWRLEVSGPVRGINYKAVFDVPVFKTAESREDFKLDPQLAAKYTSTPDATALLKSARIYEEPLAGGGVRLVFPAARNVLMACFWTLFAVQFWAVAWLTCGWGVQLLFTVVFGFSGFLLTLMTFDLWLYRSTVEASRTGLTVRGGLLGIGRTRQFAANEIDRFDSSSNMTFGTHVWSTIVVRSSTGSKCTIAKGLPGQAVVRTVLAELNTALGRT